MKSAFTPEYSTFLRVLVTERRNASLTQQDVADRLGKPQSFVSKYERGERRLDVIEFLGIARALRIDPAKLIKKLERVIRRGR